MKDTIIRKALVLLGSSSFSLHEGSKASKAENLCSEFVASILEENLLAVKWPFALKRLDNIAGEAEVFKEIDGVNDCLKVALIAPSNLEWYSENGKIYFKASRLSSVLYYPKRILLGLLNGDNSIIRTAPESFKLLSALSLAAQVAFALYADSMFADGLKKQYLMKLNEIRNLYSASYNIINSAEL